MDDMKNIIDRASHEEIHSLLDALPHAVYECDTDGRIQYHNKAYSDISGYSSEEIYSMRVWEFQMPGPSREELPGFLKKLAAEQPDPSPYLCSNLTKDGRIIDVQVDWKYKRNSSGHVTGFACILSDVTERMQRERILKQSEEVLRESERRFRNLARLMPEIVFETDSEGMITFANENAYDVLGYSQMDIEAGVNALEFIAPEHRDRAKSNIGRVLAGEDIGVSEYDVLKSDGSRVPVLLRSSRRVENGEPIGLCGVIVVISERKRMEDDLRQALSDKDRLISEIHHRIKNNLLIIQSLLRLQSGGIEDETSREYLLASEDRIRVISMIHERLYRSGDPRGLDAKEYIEAMAKQLYRVYKANPDVIRLEVDVPAERIDVDTAIPCGLIISELLTNSLKHAFPDGRKGAIYIALKQQPGGDSMLSVRDTGVGLSDDLDMEQADTLGMKIVSTLTRQLRGSLDVERLGGVWVRVSFREKRFA